MQLKSTRNRKVSINITSLVDVQFILLIFFMVSTSFTEQQGMKLELPESASAASEKIKELILEIRNDDILILNNEQVAMNDLSAKFKQLIPSLKDKSLVLKADKHVSHGTVVQVMDIAKLSGLEKLIIATKMKAE
ncbi:MAG: ExbD/TolR family protein [Candidatus Zhuqueibacterota bacterium]